MEASVSPETIALSMFCSSKQTPTPRAFSSRVALRKSCVYLATRDIDFTRTLSIRYDC